jgi:hypothetical protein
MFALRIDRRATVIAQGLTNELTSRVASEDSESGNHHDGGPVWFSDWFAGDPTSVTSY